MLKIIRSLSDLDTEQLLEVCKEDNLDAEDLLSYLYDDFFRQKDAFYAVWAPQGQYKAALRIEPYADGLLLEALSTAPNERRKGYGYMLVAEVLQFLSTLPYKVVYSHISKKNVPSLELHKKCGFQLFSDSAKYIDGTVTQKSCTMCYYL